MMNLDVMRRLVAEAEQGSKSMPTARRALAHWEWDGGSLVSWRYSANAIYIFRQGGDRRVLRLVHAGDRRHDHIQAELDFIRYLGAQGIPAMQPLPSLTGEFIVTVESPYAAFFATVFEYASGSQVDEIEDLDDGQLAAWGRAMARLHRASEGYTPPGPDRPGWQDIVENIASWLTGDEPAARRYLEQAVGWLSGLPRGAGDYGLIHGDFELDNLAWDSEDYQIFDFDDAACFWYAADLAFALYDVLEMPPAARDQIMGAFLSGYRTIRPSIDDWLETLPRFVRFMRLFKFARVLHTLSFADPALDPPWMAELRVKLMRYVNKGREIFKAPF